MARKKVSYFRHNYADWTPGLKVLGFDLGIGGVGLYWILVERLYQDGGSLPWPEIDALAAAWKVTEEYIRRVVCDYDLFEYNGDKVWNTEIVNALERQQKTSESRRNVVLKRWTNNQPADGENVSKSQENDQKRPENDQETPERVPETTKSGTNDAERVPEPPILTPETTDDEKKAEQINYDRIKDAWIRICCPKLPEPRTITTQRKLKIRTRFHDFTPDVCQNYGVADPYEMFERLFEKIVESPFLAGNNDRGWVADLDWIINSPNNWTKVIEGRYTNLGKPAGNNKKQESNINPNSLWT